MKEKAITSIRQLLYLPASILCGIIAAYVLAFIVSIVVGFIHMITPISFDAKSLIDLICYLCIPFVFNKYAFWGAMAVAPRKSVHEAYVWTILMLTLIIFDLLLKQEINIPAFLSCFQVLYYGYIFSLITEG